MTHDPSGAIGDRLRENIQNVLARIEKAASTSGRTPDAIQLVAVTKYVDADLTCAVVRAGCRHLGESRPQELWHKADALRELDVVWHLIGHLQRNKVRRTLPLLNCLESVDSLRLLHSIDSEWQQRRQQEHGNSKLDVFLEVNVSGDETKTGFSPEECPAVVEQAIELESIRIQGLMAMSGRESSLDEARRQFTDVRELRDSLNHGLPPERQLIQLSMGMSRDFDVAIEEGATTVRIGSLLFDGCLE